MPLYEFVCDDCGKPFELLVGFSQADQPQACPDCGGKETHRKVSTFAMGGSSSGSAMMSGAPARGPFT